MNSPTAQSDPALMNAAEALDAMAAGITPNRRQVLSGALALNTLCSGGTSDRELLDAAAGLDALATGHELDLNEQGRVRAARLAARVRREVSSASSNPTGIG